jgi:hypothetical protein
MEKSTLKAVINPSSVNLAHVFFDHIEEQEKVEISRELFCAKSHFVGIEENGFIKFAAIISIENNAVHLREVGGKFSWGMRYIDFYCMAIAKGLNKKFLTFHTEKPKIAALGMRYGFKPENEKDYIKAIV